MRAQAGNGSAIAPSAGPSRLIAGVCKLAAQRNEALRLFLASRHATDLAAQREFWLEFWWIDQQYRAAVHQLAEFCRQRLADQAASPIDQSDDVSMETCVTPVCKALVTSGA